MFSTWILPCTGMGAGVMGGNVVGVGVVGAGVVGVGAPEGSGVTDANVHGDVPTTT